MPTLQTTDPMQPGWPTGLFDAPEIVDFAVVGLPDGCTGWKIRHRADAFSRIFLRFADGIEERDVLIGEVSGTLVPGAHVLASTRRGGVA